VGHTACGRPSTYCLDLNLRHSDTDPNALEHGWIVAAADRPTHIDKLLVAQSAANYQFFPFPLDDVVIAEFEQYTQRRSLTGVFGEIWKKAGTVRGVKSVLGLDRASRAGRRGVKYEVPNRKTA
jgi:hypothetical protein